MHVRIINSYRMIVTIADSELIGRKFEDGKFQLDVKESFFKSAKEYSEEEIKEIMLDAKKEDATFNIVGEKSVNTALEIGLIDKTGIGKIQGIPFALVLL